MKIQIETDAKGFQARANYTHRDHAFGVVDNKGREYGARISAFEINMVPAPTDADENGCRPWTQDGEPGIRYVYCGQAMRGGKTFGATQPDCLFKNKHDRDAAMAKYLRGAKARAEKVSVALAHYVLSAAGVR